MVFLHFGCNQEASDRRVGQAIVYYGLGYDASILIVIAYGARQVKLSLALPLRGGLSRLLEACEGSDFVDRASSSSLAEDTDTPSSCSSSSVG